MKAPLFSRYPNKAIQPEIKITDDPYEIMRTYFSLASDSEKKFNEGLSFLQTQLKNNPQNIIWQTYQAAFKTIEAKHTYFPLDKLRKATEGINQLDRLVTQNPTNIEVRFIRMAVLHRLPSLFGKKSEAVSEAQRISQELTNAHISESLRKYILEFMKQTQTR
jgi:hypothetical protein